MYQQLISLCVCLFLFGASSGDERQQPPRRFQIEERARLSSQSFKNLVGSQDFERGIPDVIGQIGGIADLTRINYSASPKKVIVDVGNAIVPLITTGLSLIPGGALIGGIVSAVWGIFSGLFGGPAAKSPLELMVDEMKEEIKTIKNDIAALKASLNITIQKHIDATMSKIMNNAVHGEIRRNEYVCRKYALLSQDFSEDLKNNRKINETLRSEMVAQIHDCDDFLKDTTESFVYPDYADVLWVPCVITTLVRVSFLTEISNYGWALGIDKNVINMFWEEIKDDIKKTLEFYGFGVRKRVEIIKPMNNDEKWSLGNFSTIEYEGCVMQAQLLYLDAQMYPYGVPKYYHVFDGNGELKISDYNVTESAESHHIQLYYNELYRHSENPTTILNCFMGPDRVSRVPSESLSFRVTYVPKKTYEMRVLYFAKTISDRFVKVKDEGGNNNYIVTIDDGKPNNDSAQRFAFPTAFHDVLTNIAQLLYSKKSFSEETFVYAGDFTEGAYVVENVLAFTVESNDETSGKIEVINDSFDLALILGVEFIVQPLNNVT